MSVEQKRPSTTTVWLVPGDPADLLTDLADITGFEITVVALDQLPERPFDLHDHRLAVAVDLPAHDDGATIVAAAARGVDVVLHIAADHPRRTALLDELARVADLRDLARAASGPLTPEQGGLLAALAEGDSVAVAARRVGMSRRTAYRRLEEVGAALGTSTVRATVEAARAAGLLPDGLMDRRRR